MDTGTWGALAFGVVVGWVAYRTIRRTKTNGLNDISAVIAAVGGGAVTALFPAGSAAFGAYGIGLAIGFFLYLIISLFVAAQAGTLSAASEWLGEPPMGATPRPATAGGAAVPTLPTRPGGV